MYFILLYLFVFGFFAEIIFWDEFQTRFNFIAVDYLIYTTEVVANIVESYPLGIILGTIFIIAAVIYYLTHKKVLLAKEDNFGVRFKKFAILSIVALVAFFAINSNKLAGRFTNKYLTEISENGVYQLFSAYRNNELNYAQLYETIDPEASLQKLRASIIKQEPNSKFINQDDISRLVKAPHAGGEKKYFPACCLRVYPVGWSSCGV